MARYAVRVTIDRTELAVAAGPVEARRLEAHRVHIRPCRPQPSRFILDRLHQLRPVVLAAQLLLDPEPLNEQHRGPKLADNPADDLVALAQGNRETLVSLLAQLLRVVPDQPAEHR